MISIVMPAFNASETILKSIESVTSQSYKEWELIIIDDCSTDDTAEIVLPLSEQDPRLIYLKNETNRGVAHSRNNGIKKARGEWIAFLDSDDLWGNTKLEKQLAFMKAKKAKISYTATAYINSEGKRSNYVLQAKEKLTFRDLLKSNLMSCSSVMVSRDIMQNFPETDEMIHEDYVVWLNILQGENYAYGLNEPLLIYRLSASSKSGNRIRSAKMIFNAYRRVGFGFLSSMLLTLFYSVHSITKRRKVKHSIM